MSSSLWSERGRGTIEPESARSEWQGGVGRERIVKRGVTVLLFALSALFLLLVSAYATRMHYEDWESLAPPGILWLSTALLVLASLALEWARRSLASGGTVAARRALWLAGVLAIGFLVAQWNAWQALQALGYYLAANPANSFFYLLTGMHAVHVIAGLVVWALALSRLRADPPQAALTVLLCGVYWHFLLVVWLVLYAVLLAT